MTYYRIGRTEPNGEGTTVLKGSDPFILERIFKIFDDINLDDCRLSPWTIMTLRTATFPSRTTIEHNGEKIEIRRGDIFELLKEGQ